MWNWWWSSWRHGLQEHCCWCYDLINASSNIINFEWAWWVKSYLFSTLLLCRIISQVKKSVVEHKDICLVMKTSPPLSRETWLVEGCNNSSNCHKRQCIYLDDAYLKGIPVCYFQQRSQNRNSVHLVAVKLYHIL